MRNIFEILSAIRPECNYEASSDFIADGILDSFDVVTLVSEIEENYHISILGTDILPENFSSLNKINALLERYGVRQ